MSMDPKVGDFPQADVLIEGNQIRDVKPNRGNVGGAGEIDARGRIVMPALLIRITTSSRSEAAYFTERGGTEPPLFVFAMLARLAECVGSSRTTDL